MPKSTKKLGVSRQVRYSQPGPRGQSQTTVLNQSALARRREAAVKVQADLVQGASFLDYLGPGLYLNVFSLYLGLTGDEKRALEEFGGIPSTQPVDVDDPSSAVPEGELWDDLGQGTITQGFIDDIQGLLEGK